MSGVLILGASGHLGSALRERSREGVEITAAYATHPLVGGVCLQFEQTNSLPKADVAIGCFPLARLLEGHTEAKIDEAVRAYVGRCGDAHIVQLSTDAVFSGVTGRYGEDDAVDPASKYGRAQALVDAALLRYASKCLIVRTSFIFGWAGGRFDKRLAPFALRYKMPIEQKWANNVYRTPTEVNFLAEGIWRAIERGMTGILNIAGPRRCIYDFFADALGEIGKFEMPRPFEDTDASTARDTSLRTARMEIDLGLNVGEVWKWYHQSMRRRRDA